jgi:hypothetical protein
LAKGLRELSKQGHDKAKTKPKPKRVALKYQKIFKNIRQNQAKRPKKRFLGTLARGPSIWVN